MVPRYAGAPSVLLPARGVVVFVAVLGGRTGVVLSHWRLQLSAYRRPGRHAAPRPLNGTWSGQGPPFLHYGLRELCCHLSSSGPDGGFTPGKDVRQHEAAFTLIMVRV